MWLFYENDGIKPRTKKELGICRAFNRRTDGVLMILMNLTHRRHPEVLSAVSLVNVPENIDPSVFRAPYTNSF